LPNPSINKKRVRIFTFMHWRDELILNMELAIRGKPAKLLKRIHEGGEVGLTRDEAARYLDPNFDSKGRRQRTKALTRVTEIVSTLRNECKKYFAHQGKEAFSISEGKYRLAWIKDDSTSDTLVNQHLPVAGGADSTGPPALLPQAPSDDSTTRPAATTADTCSFCGSKDIIFNACGAAVCAKCTLQFSHRFIQDSGSNDSISVSVDVHCNFCLKDGSTAVGMVEKPSVHICSECLGEAVRNLCVRGGRFVIEFVKATTPIAKSAYKSFLLSRDIKKKVRNLLYQRDDIALREAEKLAAELDSPAFEKFLNILKSDTTPKSLLIMERARNAREQLGNQDNGEPDSRMGPNGG
jgi:hypothetical protein